MARIRLLVVDDHPVVRAGLRTLLAGQPDLEIVGEADNGAAAVQQALRLKPDVVVMDISMAGSNGAEATAEIRRRLPDAKVLVLTIHNDEEHLQQMLQAGATGYVLKEAADAELAVAIRSVHRGDIFIHPALTRLLLGGVMGVQAVMEAPDRDPDELLTDREKEVLRLVALGDTNREIAARLYLSVRTVETYRARIMEKLDLKSRSELVRYALRKGLRHEKGPHLDKE